jgi:hypothetical protein
MLQPWQLRVTDSTGSVIANVRMYNDKVVVPVPVVPMQEMLNVLPPSISVIDHQVQMNLAPISIERRKRKAQAGPALLAKTDLLQDDQCRLEDAVRRSPASYREDDTAFDTLTG